MPKKTEEIVPIPVPMPVIGLKGNLPRELVPNRALVDCHNIDVFQNDMGITSGWGAFEGMQSSVVDPRGPIALVTELAKLDGTFKMVVGTSADLYKRTGYGVFDFLTQMYTTGTIAVTSGSPIVTGTGTIWSTAGLKNGDRIKLDAHLDDLWHTILNVDNDLQITLTTNYAGPSGSGTYKVRKVNATINSLRWSTTVFNDVMIFAHLGTKVQKWDGITPTTQDLNTPGLTNFKAVWVVEAFNRVIAIHVESGGTVFPQRVQWPDNGTSEGWNLGEAGFLDIVEGPDFNVAGYKLGNFLVIYKENSIHIMTYIGGIFVFQRRQVITGTGLISPRACADLGDTHLILAADNFYLFNGINLKPIGDDVIDDLLGVVDIPRAYDIQAFIHEERGIVNFVIPKTGGGYRCYSYHYKTSLFGDTHIWTKRDLPATAIGYITQQNALTWANATNPWLFYDIPWASRAILSFFPLPVFGGEDGRLWGLGDFTTHAGVAIEGFAEFGPIGLSAGDQTIENFMKELAYIRPWAERVAQPFNLEVGITKQNRLGGTPVTVMRKNYRLDQSGKPEVTFRIGGDMFYPRFSTPTPPETGNIWRLKGYTVGIVIRGTRKQ